MSKTKQCFEIKTLKKFSKRVTIEIFTDCLFL